MPNEFADSEKITDWYLAGTELSADAVAATERKVASNPNDTESRVKLLGFYFALRNGDESAQEAAQPHILWIISNFPDSEAAGEPWVRIRKSVDPSRYEAVREAWCENLRKHPDNAQVMANAARFFLLNEMALSEELLMQAQALEPDNAEWTERLGHLFSLKATDGDAASKSESHGKALELFEAALAVEGKPRFYQLDTVAKAAFKAGHLDKARTYSTELLAIAPSFDRNWNYGNAIYTGNSILALIALGEGDMNLARTYMLAASLTPGSPQLDSFGPDLTIAKEMLDRGEREAVVNFLNNVSKFWDGRVETITEWKEIIRRGQIPIFRPQH